MGAVGAMWIMSDTVGVIEALGDMGVLNGMGGVGAIDAMAVIGDIDSVCAGVATWVAGVVIVRIPQPEGRGPWQCEHHIDAMLELSPSFCPGIEVIRYLFNVAYTPVCF